MGFFKNPVRLFQKPRQSELEEKVKSGETPTAVKGGSVAEALQKHVSLPIIGFRV